MQNMWHKLTGSAHRRCYVMKNLQFLTDIWSYFRHVRNDRR